MTILFISDSLPVPWEPYSSSLPSLSRYGNSRWVYFCSPPGSHLSPPRPRVRSAPGPDVAEFFLFPLFTSSPGSCSKFYLSVILSWPSLTILTTSPSPKGFALPGSIYFLMLSVPRFAIVVLLSALQPSPFRILISFQGANVNGEEKRKSCGFSMQLLPLAHHYHRLRGGGKYRDHWLCVPGWRRGLLWRRYWGWVDFPEADPALAIKSEDMSTLKVQFTAARLPHRLPVSITPRKPVTMPTTHTIYFCDCIRSNLPGLMIRYLLCKYTSIKCILLQKSVYMIDSCCSLASYGCWVRFLY